MEQRKSETTHMMIILYLEPTARKGRQKKKRVIYKAAMMTRADEEKQAFATMHKDELLQCEHSSKTYFSFLNTSYQSNIAAAPFLKTVVQLTTLPKPHRRFNKNLLVNQPSRQKRNLDGFWMISEIRIVLRTAFVDIDLMLQIAYKI